MNHKQADIRAATEGLARAIVSGEVAPSGRDPVRFAAELLQAGHPELPVPEQLCSYSLLLSLVVGGASCKASIETTEG